MVHHTIEIGSAVSEHGLPSNFWLHLYLEVLDRFSPLKVNQFE